MGVFLMVAAFVQPPDVCITDANWFPANYEACLSLRMMAYRHSETMKGEVFGWNCLEVFEQWQEECKWRLSCWDALEDAKNPAIRVNDDWRLGRLASLKGLIGDEAYYAGRMPDPLPTYRR